MKRKSGRQQQRGEKKRGFRHWSKSRRILATLCGLAALLLVLAMVAPTIISVLSGKSGGEEDGVEIVEGAGSSDGGDAIDSRPTNDIGDRPVDSGGGVAQSAAEEPAERQPSTTAEMHSPHLPNVEVGNHGSDAEASLMLDVLNYGDAENDNVRVLLADWMGYSPDRVAFGSSTWGRNGRLPLYPLYVFDEEGECDSPFAYTWGGTDGKTYIDLEDEDESVLVYNEEDNALKVVCDHTETIWVTDDNFSKMYVVTLEDGVANLVIPETSAVYKIAYGVNCVMNGGFDDEGVSILAIYSFDNTTSRESCIAKISVTAPMEDDYIPVQGHGDFWDTIAEVYDTAMRAEPMTCNFVSIKRNGFQDAIGEFLDTYGAFVNEPRVETFYDALGEWMGREPGKLSLERSYRFWYEREMYYVNQYYSFWNGVDLMVGLIWEGSDGNIYTYDGFGGKVGRYDVSTNQCVTLFDHVRDVCRLTDEQVVMVTLEDGELGLVLPETGEGAVVASDVDFVLVDQGQSETRLRAFYSYPDGTLHVSQRLTAQMAWAYYPHTIRTSSSAVYSTTSLRTMV